MIARPQKTDKLLLCLIAIAIALRMTILAVFLWRSGASETWEYERIAQSLLAGQGYASAYNGTIYRSQMMPLYPLLSVLFHLLAGPGFAVFYALNLAAAALSILLAHDLTKNWLGRPTALAAAALIAVEPGLIVYQSYKLEAMSLSMVLILLFLKLLLDSSRRPAKRWNGLAPGLAAGCGVLIRPDMILLLGTGAVFAALGRSKERLKTLVIIGLCVVGLLSPWALRNRAIHGRWIWFTTTAGEHLWIGNNPRSTGGAALDARVPSRLSAADPKLRRELLALDEDGQDLLFARTAWDFILSDPATFFSRALLKFRLFWWFGPFYGTQYAWLPDGLAQTYRLLYGGLLVLILLGAGKTFYDASPAVRETAYCLASLPVLTTLLRCIYYVEGRHRVLIMPVLLIFAAHGMVLCYNSVKTR